MMEDRFKATMKRLIPFGATCIFGPVEMMQVEWLYGGTNCRNKYADSPERKELEMFRYDVKNEP